MTKKNRPTDCQYGREHMKIPPALDNSDQIKEFACCYKNIGSRIRNEDIKIENDKLYLESEDAKYRLNNDEADKMAGKRTGRSGHQNGFEQGDEA